MLCRVKTGYEKQPGKETGDYGERSKQSEPVLNCVTHEEGEEEEGEEEEEEEEEEEKKKKKKNTLILMMLIIHISIINVLGKKRIITEAAHETQENLLHVSDSSSVHHQEFFTVHTAMVYVIKFCRQLSANLYDIHHCCVYSEKLLMMNRGIVRNMQTFIPKINLRNQCIQLVLL